MIKLFSMLAEGQKFEKLTLPNWIVKQNNNFILSYPKYIFMHNTKFKQL